MPPKKRKAAAVPQLRPASLATKRRYAELAPELEETFAAVYAANLALETAETNRAASVRDARPVLLAMARSQLYKEYRRLDGCPSCARPRVPPTLCGCDVHSHGPALTLRYSVVSKADRVNPIRPFEWYSTAPCIDCVVCRFPDVFYEQRGSVKRIPHNVLDTLEKVSQPVVRTTWFRKAQSA